ncbi:MAG: 50S ribosomal protein L23 [Proteobacteria bacterium]|nr:50S ribosomal protein L23 [Pseudomonadota bacterium]
MSQERLLSVLVGPHISEKSTNLLDAANQVVFKVRRDATKMEVRRAVEKLFEVQVDNVTIANVRGKVKRFGANIGRRQDWKKAYVRLAPGQKIEEFDFAAGGE